jgi:hypothetical protein
LSVDIQTIDNMISDGRLRASKLGRRVVIRLVDIEKTLTACEVEWASAPTEVLAEINHRSFVGRRRNAASSKDYPIHGIEQHARGDVWYRAPDEWVDAFHEASLGPVHGPPTPTLLAISSSLVPASAASKICALLSLRDACLPPLSSVLSAVRSIWLSSTR